MKLLVILSSVVLMTVCLAEQPEFSNEEITQLIKAINSAYSGVPYQGNIPGGKEIQQSLVDKDYKTFGLAMPSELGFETGYLSATAYPGPHGISITVSSTCLANLPDSSVRIHSETSEIYLYFRIPEDPDKGKSAEKMKRLYSPKEFKKMGEHWGVTRETALNEIVLFIESVKQNRETYSMAIASDTVKIFPINGEMHFNNFAAGFEILFSAADLAGKKNGIATSWEIASLQDSLPWLAEFSQGNLSEDNLKKSTGLKPGKAREIWENLQNITSMSEVIILE